MEREDRKLDETRCIDSIERFEVCLAAVLQRISKVVDGVGFKEEKKRKALTRVWMDVERRVDDAPTIYQ